MIDFLWPSFNPFPGHCFVVPSGFPRVCRLVCRVHIILISPDALGESCYRATIIWSLPLLGVLRSRALVVEGKKIEGDIKGIDLVKVCEVNT